MEEPKMPWRLRYMRHVVMLVTGIPTGILLRIFIGTSSWHEIVGPILVCSGGWLNYTVIQANGMKMPVFPRKVSKSPWHVDGNSDTRYPWLCDRIPLGIGIGSVGDILIFLALIVSVVEYLRG